MHMFQCACAKRPYFHFRSKIWRHHRVPRSRFSIRRKNFGDSRTFKAGIRLLLIFARIFQDSWLKMFWEGAKIREEVVRCWPPTNLFFLLLGVFTSVPILVKIDRKCDRESAHSRIHTLTDVNRFWQRVRKARYADRFTS